MYTTQTGPIQIFDQLSAHFIKTASSSTAKSFVKYCLVYSSLQCKKISGEGKRRKEFAEWNVERRAEWHNYAK